MRLLFGGKNTDLQLLHGLFFLLEELLLEFLVDSLGRGVAECAAGGRQNVNRCSHVHSEQVVNVGKFVFFRLSGGFEVFRWFWFS